jgi:DNA mismatch repair protein MutL
VNIISKLQSTPYNKTTDVYLEERFQSKLNRANLEHWENLLEGDWLSKAIPEPTVSTQELRFESAINKPVEQATTEDRWLHQLHNRYILRQVRSGLMIVDQQAAHQRILYEKNLERLRQRRGESQQSLFPQTIEMAPADFAMVLEMDREIVALGFRYEVFGKNALLLSGIPAHLPVGSEKMLFEGLIEQFKINQSEHFLPLEENLARALASRAGIKPGQTLQREEMQSLLDQLFACKTPNYAADGTPTFFIFELGKIQSHFNRP